MSTLNEVDRLHTKSPPPPSPPPSKSCNQTERKTQMVARDNGIAGFKEKCDILFAQPSAVVIEYSVRDRWERAERELGNPPSPDATRNLDTWQFHYDAHFTLFAISITEHRKEVEQQALNELSWVGSRLGTKTGEDGKPVSLEHHLSWTLAISSACAGILLYYLLTYSIVIFVMVAMFLLVFVYTIKVPIDASFCDVVSSPVPRPQPIAVSC